MSAYLNLVSIVSLVGFYGAMYVLFGVAPEFALGVDDGAAVRSTIATTLGIAITTLPLWYLHWHALRRVWDRRGIDGRGYLFVVNSIAVLAAAITAGVFVRHATALLLGTAPVADAGTATLWAAGLRFLLAALLWRHHWGILQDRTDEPDDNVRARPGMAHSA